MNESKRKDLEIDQNKNSGGEGPVPPFSVENPCSFSEKYPMGVSFARCKKEDEEYAADGI